jgi:fructose-bisphosphate aldolase class II
LELVRRCVAAGFTSVMIDASNLPFADNVRVTRQVVELAHPRGISVEAELGTLQGVEDNVSVAERDAVLVNPEQAQQFVTETGIDSLAPAIGTSHGAFKFSGEPELDFERLKKVKALTGVPLVLHGASSVPDAVKQQALRYGARLEQAQGVPVPMIQQAIRLGVAKVNVDTDLRLGWLASIRRSLAEEPGQFDPRRILGPARDAMTAIVRQRIRAFRLEN